MKSREEIERENSARLAAHDEQLRLRVELSRRLELPSDRDEVFHRVRAWVDSYVKQKLETGYTDKACEYAAETMICAVLGDDVYEKVLNRMKGGD